MESKEGRKAANYAIGDAVQTLEEFKPEEYKQAETLHWVDTQAPYVHTDDYLKYVEGFIDNKPPYSNHPWGGGLLNQVDIRDGASHNMFPLQLRIGNDAAGSHDMHHFHYALGHPRPVALYFKTARSHNAARFVTIGAMYEGVDQVQYGHERQLAQYMATQMNMDLEDAMVYIAKAPKEDFDKLLDAAGIRSAIEAGANQLNGWAPQLKGVYTGVGHSGGSLDADIEAFVDRGQGYIARPELNKYTYFKRAPVSGQVPDHQKDIILYNERVTEKERAPVPPPVPVAPPAQPVAPNPAQ
jgi:hypothetical protein